MLKLPIQNNLPDRDPDRRRLDKVGRMNKLIKTAVSVTVLFIAQGALACDYPQRIDVPNGTTSSKEDMITGQKSVKAYMASMEEYLACIEAGEAQAIKDLGAIDEDAKRQREEMFNKKYNAAVEEMNLVAEEFNMQVRAYKDRNR
jgi:hypothetical protein